MATSSASPELMAELTSAPPATNQLAPDSVSGVGLVAQSVATAAPELTVATAATVALLAGGSVAVAFVIAGVLYIAFARILVVYSRQIADAGGVFSIIRFAAGETVGFFGGWLYLMGIAIFAPGVCVLGASFLQSSLIGIFPHSHWLVANWLPWALGYALLTSVLVYYGIRPSVNVQLGISVLGVASFSVLAVVILFNGGPHGIAWGTLAPWDLSSGVSTTSFLTAVGVAMASFLGAESCVFLAEETHAPRRILPKAIGGTVACLLTFYVVMSLGYVTGLGSPAAASKAWSSLGGQVVLGLSGQYMFRGYGHYLLVLLAIASVSNVLGIVNTCARLQYAWAREGKMPAILARTHKRHQTPHTSIAAITAFTIGVIVAGYIWKGGSAAAAPTVFTWILLFGVLLLLVVLALVGLVDVVRQARMRSKSVLAYSSGAIAIIGFGLAIYSNVHPPPPPPFNVAPYAAIGWGVAGIVIALFFRRRLQMVGRSTPPHDASPRGDSSTP